jgi:hypothetical protein
LIVQALDHYAAALGPDNNDGKRARFIARWARTP